MRYTHYDEHKKRWQINDDYGAMMIDELNYAVGEAVDKLAAYEDTGLEPDEIKLNMDGLDEYRKAEAEGRLMILPCKVGDTLFFAQVGREEPFSMRVQGISISASGNDVILHFGGFPITNAWGSEVGKTLFLTRAEAEAALKGERKADGG